MIRMCVEADIVEDMDTLHAREEIAKRVYLRLTTVEWIKSVRVVNE